MTRGWTYTIGSEAAVGGGTMPAGLMLSATDGRGKVISYDYDDRGDLRQVTNPAGLVMSFEYAPLGAISSVTVSSAAFPNGVTTQYTYDARGNRVSGTGPVVHDAVTGAAHQLRTDNSYDASGALVGQRMHDVVGGGRDRLVTYTLDGSGRVSDADVTG